MCMRRNLILIFMGVAMFSLCFNATANAYTPWYLWSSGYRNSHYYYVYSQWDEFYNAQVDWNNLGSDFGTMARTYVQDGAYCTVVKYNSDDGNCGYCTQSHSGSYFTAIGIHLNDWFLIGGDPNLGLPLDTANKRKSVCAHEIGHDHSCDDVKNTNATDTIMRQTAYGRLTRGTWTPQNWDKNAVNSFY